MTPVGPSRGSELLVAWQGERLAKDVAPLLGLDEADYSRFRNGVRKPRGETAFRIAQITAGAIPATSWYEPIAKKPARARRSPQRRARAS